jgi:hypothetical protein
LSADASARVDERLNLVKKLLAEKDLVPTLYDLARICR